MTKIDFFSNTPNRLEYVVRLLKKVQAQAQNAVVFGEVDVINHLSDALWQLEGFHPHDLYHAFAPSTLHASILLISTLPDELPHHDVLINLTDELPGFFASFLRLIEVVPDEEPARIAARERWTHYKSRGYVMKHHNIAQK